MIPDTRIVPQDGFPAKNQKEEFRCGDNGVSCPEIAVGENRWNPFNAKMPEVKWYEIRLPFSFSERVEDNV